VLSGDSGGDAAERGAGVSLGTKLEVHRHIQSVKNELAFLKQMALAAKVVAHVTSPMHKKLLNLVRHCSS
jgi:hypothetical protein